MINEIRYETFQKDVNYDLASVFLAGPTVRGNQTHLKSWRPYAIKEFSERDFEGNLIIPEFSSRTESDQYRYDIPLWEFEGLIKCDVIMFWIPRTPELIGLTTNHELGYWTARDRNKVVYGRPKEAYRMSYIDIMWVEDYKNRFNRNHDCPIYTSLEKTVEESVKKVSLIRGGK